MDLKVERLLAGHRHIEAPRSSGAKYQGSNESLWEHHGEAMITWGYGSPEMQCTRKPRN